VFVAGLMHSLHLRFFSGGMLMPSWFDIHDAPITSVRYLCHNENSPVYAMLAEARKGTIVMFT
jgi:hypothetical protein